MPEAPIAMSTFVWFQSHVYFLVSFPTELVTEPLVTEFTAERSGSGVGAFVSRHVALETEASVTESTLVFFHPSVYHFVATSSTASTQLLVAIPTWV